MVITFYNNISEKNVIRKTINNALTMSGTLRESTSVTNPIITIEAPVTLIGYNYCYILDFSRYYYVVDVKSMRNNLWAVTLRVDVLMSFQNDILNTPAIIDHTTQQDTTNYMASNVWQSLVKDKTDIINFSNGLSESGGYVLITAGG
jgi:hypothetical protein